MLKKLVLALTAVAALSGAASADTWQEPIIGDNGRIAQFTVDELQNAKFYNSSFHPQNNRLGNNTHINRAIKVASQHEGALISFQGTGSCLCQYETPDSSESTYFDKDRTFAVQDGIVPRYNSKTGKVEDFARYAILASAATKGTIQYAIDGPDVFFTGWDVVVPLQPLDFSMDYGLDEIVAEKEASEARGGWGNLGFFN